MKTVWDWTLGHIQACELCPTPRREAAARLECDEMTVDLSREAPSAISFRKQRTRITSRGSLARRHLTRFPCLRVACVLSAFSRFMILHEKQTAFRRTEEGTFRDPKPDSSFQRRGSFEWPQGLWRKTRSVHRICLPSIMNNLLTIRGCCWALLCCRAQQPETLSYSLITRQHVRVSQRVKLLHMLHGSFLILCCCCGQVWTVKTPWHQMKVTFDFTWI